MAISDLTESAPPATPTEPPSHIRMKAIQRAREPCTHCLRPLPKGWRSSFCRMCIEEEGPPVHSEGELEGVKLARAAGLRAIARPCADGVARPGAPAHCDTCRALLERLSVRPRVEETSNPRSAHFTDQDGEDLRRYFSKAQKAGIGVGSSSGFTMMCDRIGDASNYKSKEQPQRTEPRCPICAAKLRAVAVKERADAKAASPKRSAQELLDVLMTDVATGLTDAVGPEAFGASPTWGPDRQASFEKHAKAAMTMTDEERDRLERDPVAYAARFKKAMQDAEDAEEKEWRGGLGGDPTDAHLMARQHLHRTHASALKGHLEALLGDAAEKLHGPLPLVIVGDETLPSAPEKTVLVERPIDVIFDVQWRDADVPLLAAPLTSTHRHSKADVEAFKPIRHYDTSINGQVVSVQVFPPSIEPLTYESHRVPTHGSAGAGKFGSWDDEAVEYVEGRSRETVVNRIFSRLAEIHRDRLEAYYTQTEELAVRSGSDSLLGAYTEVALTTEAAKKAHDAAAESGQVATVRDVVEALKKRAAGTSTNRESAVKRLETMRKQAEELIVEAQAAYAWAASEYT